MIHTLFQNETLNVQLFTGHEKHTKIHGQIQNLNTIYFQMNDKDDDFQVFFFVNTLLISCSYKENKIPQFS